MHTHTHTHTHTRYTHGYANEEGGSVSCETPPEWVLEWLHCESVVIAEWDENILAVEKNLLATSFHLSPAFGRSALAFRCCDWTRANVSSFSRSFLCVCVCGSFLIGNSTTTAKKTQKLLPVIIFFFTLLFCKVTIFVAALLFFFSAVVSDWNGSRVRSSTDMLLIRASKLPARLTFLHADRVHIEHYCAYTDRCFQHCTALNWVILDYFSIGLICIGSCTICVARFIIIFFFLSKPDAAPLLCHWYTRLIQVRSLFG